MNKALIVTAKLDSPDMVTISSNDYDCIICADGGLLVAKELGLAPDLLIGDYDSMEMPKDSDVIKLPRVKDMTDTEAAIDLAVSKGYDDITVLGGLGGRFDHTMGNIGMLRKFLLQDITLSLMDGQNLIRMLSPGAWTIPKQNYTYLGLIAYESPCTGLSVSGTKYPLTDFTLTNDTSLGVSNEILAEEASLSFDGGVLLAISSRDRG